MANITVRDVQKFKQQKKKFAVLTAYDYWTACLLDAAGIDVLLVGDSLGMVMLGHATTLPTTMDDMVSHAAAVSRGAKRSMVVADMPFMSYQVSVEDTVRNAGRLLQEGRVAAVKLEGGAWLSSRITALLDSGVPVMGHVGLTPQSVHKLGGYRVQGRSVKDGQRLLEDALALQAVGVFALVLECVSREVAADITTALTIPTIGIGAGPSCDGQVLVTHDMLGLLPDPVPRHVKIFAPLGAAMTQAVQDYKQAVEAGVFPTDDQSFYRSTARQAGSNPPATEMHVTATGEGS